MADTPNNPEDEEQPQNSYGEEGFEAEQEESGQPQYLGKGPAVAAAPGKTLMIAVSGTLMVGFILYQLFFAESDEPPPPPPAAPTQAAPVATSDIPIPTLPVEPPPAPEPPKPEEVPLPPIPPVPQPLPEPEVDFSAQGPTNEQMIARRKSNMLIVAGASKPLIDAGGNDSLTGQPNGNIVPGSEEDKFKSAAQRSIATHVGDLRKLILQGKIIHAVLETAIDSTFPGPLRGLVTHDVYAESGKAVLIPKGSRLIGNYNADVVRGQARIFIIWTRVIRPDGVDIDISSPAVDRLGRSGLAGHIDNRFFEIFSGSLLTSVFTIGMAAASQSITGAGDTTTSQNTDGSTTQTGDPTSAAIQQAVANMGATAQQVLGGLIDLRPVITVDQGTPVNIFVNRDLEFPDEVTSRIKLLQ